ncbi:MAG: hypothetical protein INQ03_04480 [Candidatus Heimdallarchaeota archaeon]|nr:hypothetical protein [Candidatus Heimdallarchaeota archaeon]
MVEKFLVDLFQRIKKHKIAVLLSGDVVDDQVIEFLSTLRLKLKDIGDLKYARILYEDTIPEMHLDALRAAGFSHKIVPSFLELNFLIDVYDIYLVDDIDLFILGTNSESLIPMFTEIRQKGSVYWLQTGRECESIVGSCDGVISLSNIDEFIENQRDFNKYSIDGSSGEIEASFKQEIDLANIGPTSEKIDV